MQQNLFLTGSTESTVYDPVNPVDPVKRRRGCDWVYNHNNSLILGPKRSLVALTIRNDVSSRDIVGANPLYLSQAKVYIGMRSVPL